MIINSKFEYLNDDGDAFMTKDEEISATNDIMDHLFPDLSRNIYLFQINMIETDKLIILFDLKSGSTFLGNTFLENDYSHSLVQIDLLHPENKSTSESLNSIFTGNSSKELLIIHRNPIFKWLSGTFQDVVHSIEDNVFALNFICDKYNLSRHITQLNQLPVHVIGELMYEYLLSILSKNMLPVQGHSRDINLSMYTILDNPMLDKSKIHSFDLDDTTINLEKFLHQYHPELIDLDKPATPWSHRKKWAGIYGYLINIIQNDNNYKLFATINEILAKDFIFYNKIKNRLEYSVTPTK